MRLPVTIAGLSLALLLAAAAWAQEDSSADEADRPPRAGQMRQRIIEEFDADGDGELNEEERQKARAAMQERRAARRAEDGRGPRGPEGGPGPGRGGPGRGRGPDGGAPGWMPNPERLFNRLDENDDGQLSLDEFRKMPELMAEIRQRMGRGGPGEGRGPEGRRPDRPSRPERPDRPERPRRPSLDQDVELDTESAEDAN